MTAQLLDRKTHRPRPALTVLGNIELPLARLHEVCGPARHRLALMIAAATQGPVFWIAPAWQSGGLNPDGMVGLVPPERFVFLAPERAGDILWTLEEVLRSGAVPLAVAELHDLPGLTAVRRLHLAAEAGAREGRGAPLGLILTPGEGGAPGVETRWHMTPTHSPQRDAWAISRRRARTSPPCSWRLTGHARTWRLDPESAATTA